MTGPANGAITRVEPVNGLLVDADLWAAAHDFHRHHLQRHALFLHGHGIAQGLETVAHEPANRTLVIYPGLAVDSVGNPILVGECERYTIQTEQPGTIYIVLQFREVAAGARGPAGAGKPTHFREAYLITERRELPTEPYIELARVLLTGGREPVADALEPSLPGPNQIDLRHRLQAGGLLRGEIAIGQAWLEQMNRPVHDTLPLALVESLGAMTGYRGRYIGRLTPREAAGQCTLLYVASQEAIALTAEDSAGLRAFVDSGGTLLADGCHADKNDPFGETVMAIAAGLGRALQPLTRTDSLLRSPHRFAAPPAGAAAGTLLAADGLIYCQADYGCALEGGRANQPLERATIRSILEIVTNIAVVAHQRSRQVQFSPARRAP